MREIGRKEGDASVLDRGSQTFRDASAHEDWDTSE